MAPGPYAAAAAATIAPRELAKVASDAAIGGRLAKKAGLTHFHVCPGAKRLALLRRLIDEFEAKPEWLYPTHVGRGEELMDEAIALAGRGATVDVDVVERDLPRWFNYYRDNGGPADRLTASTDASVSSPRDLLDQLRACVREGVALEDVLPVATSDAARALELGAKGRAAAGVDADLLVLEAGSLELVEVVAGGRRLLRDGRPAVEEPGRANDRR
jgi:beta-aspartyl-dipeptidase (metallo-type)